MTLETGGDPEGSNSAAASHASARKPSDLGAYVDVALMILIGSTTAPAAKYAVRDLPLNWLPLLRFSMAALCLVPVVLGRGRLRKLFREDGWRLLLTAALCVPINQGFFLSATRLGPTSHVALFYSTCPLVVLMLAWGSRLERPDLTRLWGVLLSVGGVILIGLGNYLEQGGASEEARSTVISDLLLLGAVVSWGGYIAVSKSLIVRHGAMTVLAGTFLTGCLLAAPFALFLPPGMPPLREVSKSAWLGLVFLGLFVTPFGWAYQNRSLRRFDASQVATLSNASPILTVIWGMWLFGEKISLTLVIGGLMTLGGIYWICRPRAAPALVRQARSHAGTPTAAGSVERREVASTVALSEEQRPV